jgi:hypothetical protein
VSNFTPFVLLFSLKMMLQSELSIEMDNITVRFRLWLDLCYHILHQELQGRVQNTKCEIRPRRSCFHLQAGSVSDWDEVDETDEGALQGYYYNNWDPLSVVLNWIPSRATMDACAGDDNVWTETEMLDCILDNASWWAAYYIPYYFPWVFNEYDDGDDSMSAAEMDALYAEIDRRVMVWALIQIDQDIPEDITACDEFDSVNNAISWEGAGACWKRNTSWWRRYYFDYYFSIVEDWFDADDDGDLEESEAIAVGDEIQRINAWSHLFRIRRYLPSDGFDSCTAVNATAETKEEIYDCWVANVPYWKEYYFEWHFNKVWAYFDADEDDVLDDAEETALLEASEARVLMGV